MAKLYNFCTYNATKGGRYQSTSWDVCCDQWTDRPEGSPTDWGRGTENIVEWACGGANPQTWTEREQTGIDWLFGDDSNPQGWSCFFDVEVEWGDGGFNPQEWQAGQEQDVAWLTGDDTNPEVWDCGSAGTQGWEIETPEPAIYEPILKDDRTGLDCGD